MTKKKTNDKLGRNICPYVTDKGIIPLMCKKNFFLILREGKTQTTQFTERYNKMPLKHEKFKFTQ